MTLLTLLIAMAAMALFGLATSAHHERHLGCPLKLDRRRAMRIVAWSLTAFTFVPAIAGSGFVFGPIFAVGALMLASGGVFLTLNLWPARRARDRGPNADRTSQGAASVTPFPPPSIGKGRSRD